MSDEWTYGQTETIFISPAAFWQGIKNSNLYTVFIEAWQKDAGKENVSSSIDK
jgi:hypothetical protein